VVATLFGVLAGLFMLVGVGVAVHGAVRMSTTRALAAAGYRAVGVVVDNQLISHHEHLTFRPVVSFRTASGEDVTTAVGQSSYRSHVVGTSVEVVYDPRQPTRADLAVGYRSQGVAAVVGGAVFAVFAGVMLVVVLSVASAVPESPRLPNLPGLPNGVPHGPGWPNGVPQGPGWTVVPYVPTR
jgi:hypothetical protein